MITRVIYGERRANPDWLEEWARVLDLTPEESDAFIRAGKTARMLGKSDSSEHGGELIDALRASVTIAAELVAILENEDLQIPHELSETLRVLKDRWL